jgi:hypothetical protein
MAKRSFRGTVASLAFGLFLIVFVFLISGSVVQASCKGDVTARSTRDALTLALRGQTATIRFGCVGFKFDIRRFRFVREKGAYVLRGDIGRATQIAGPDAQQLKFEISTSVA